VLAELAFASLALIYLRYRGYDLKWLRPRPSSIGCIIGILLYVATAIIFWPISLIAGNTYVSSQPIQEMLFGSTYSLPMLLGTSIVNGFYEETFLTGYLLQGLLHIGPALSIGIVSLIRVMYHLYQGPIGAISALIFGVVISVYYWRTRDLWSVVVAHVFGDFAAFSMS
jgi:membrane protease YdiL (CAAX protease family)